MNTTEKVNVMNLKKASEPSKLKDIIMPHISETVDALIKNNVIFEKIDKPKLMKSLSALVEKAPEKLISITNDELTERIEIVMVIEATAGMLKDLTPEEMKVFEESAKRRDLFK